MHNDQYDSLSSHFKSLDLLCLCNCAGFGWNTVNFFTAAGMELWFGFMLETELVAEGCFSSPWAVLTQCQGPFLTHQWGGWGDHKELEGPQPGQLPTNDCRGIPFHMVACSADKAEGRRRKEGMFRVMVFAFPRHVCVCLSPGVAEHLPAYGSWWINPLFFFSCMHDFHFPCLS